MGKNRIVTGEITRIIGLYEKFVKFAARMGLRKEPLRKISRAIQYFIRRVFYDKTRKSVVNIEGNTLYLDKLDSLSLSFNKYFEPLETEIIKNTLKKGGIALDIGANIGYYTLIMAKIVGEKGRVFAFEPDPENFKLLSKNIKVNGYKNVKLINKAVGSIKGKIKLYLSEENSGNHKIFEDGSKRFFVEEDIIPPDSLFSDKRVNFIKMDVEGSEPGVLMGAKKTFLCNPQLKLVTEFYPLFIEQFGEDYKKYLKSILDYGFDIFLVDEKKTQQEKSLLKIF